MPGSEPQPSICRTSGTSGHTASLGSCKRPRLRHPSEENLVESALGKDGMPAVLNAGNGASRLSVTELGKRRQTGRFNLGAAIRSEERRVGKECRARWWRCGLKKQPK